MKNQAKKEQPYFNHFLIDHIDAVIFLVNVDQNGVFTYDKINKAHEQATGLFNDTIKGKTPVEVTGEKMGREIEANYRRCLEEAKPVSFEEELDLPSGKHSWLTKLHPVFEGGRIVQITGVSTDITEHKKLEIDLRESEEKFRKLFEKHTAVQILIDAETSYLLDANEAASEFYGWTNQELKQMKISDINTLSVDEVRREMDKAMSQERIYFEFKHRLANGEIREVEVFSNKIEIEDKVALHSIIHDITEKKENERALIESKHLAEAANIAKSEFLTNMSHELRTPLNGVIGFSEILKHTDLNEQQNEHIDTVLKSAKKLLEIINDILDFSTIDADYLELHPEETDLMTFIQKTASLIRHQATEKGLRFTIDMGEDIPKTVKVDSGKLRQVLLNLLSNAVKFTKKGDIKFKLHVIEKDANKVRILFQVIDTGIGIKEKNQNKIFKAFQQVDMSLTRKYEGTGLGLAISNDLLQKMGSTLKLKSTYGKGSEFYFELLLPYEEVKETDFEQLNDESVNKSLSIKGKKVLIAEDNLINMKYAQAALNMFSKDIQIIKAKNGKEAYRLFLEHKPDLILMDIIMPEIDGYQATAMIRSRDQQIPILAMTAKAHKEDQEDFLASGMDDFIIKPVSLEQLKNAVEKHLM